MELPGSGKFDLWRLRQSNADVDMMAKNVLEGMLRSGAWDSPGPRCIPPEGKCNFLLYQTDVTSTEHVAIAREVASSSAVLLKNENGVLPLRPSAKVALVGSACSVCTCRS